MIEEEFSKISRENFSRHFCLFFLLLFSEKRKEKKRGEEEKKKKKKKNRILVFENDAREK